MKIKVSSANYKWDTFTLSEPTWKPLNMLLASALAITWLRQSATKVKRNTETGSPCLSPLEAGKNPLGVPLSIIE